jgi:tagatose 6-phosphate kinase
MIVTVTMNPSIDISYPLETLKIDTVNRVPLVSKTAGGKGLNVTRVIHELEGEVLATGLLGGHHGAFIAEQLDNEGIQHQFSKIAGETRNSIAILHDNGKQTEILEAGPTVSAQELADFEGQLNELLKKASLVTLSGSLAKGIPVDYYRHLLSLANQYGVKTLLDTSGASLKASLESADKPFLIKPNTEEIAELIGQELVIDDVENVKAILSSPIFEGVEWIVVSLGSKGAIVKHDATFYRVEIPKIEVVNPVGSGDSTIAGLAFALDANLSDEEILQYGMVTGMLNAMETKTGHINVANLAALKDQIKVSPM